MTLAPMEQRKKRDKIAGIVGTAVVHILLIALLSYCVMTAVRVEEEGLLVNYGTTDNGSGQIEPAPNAAQPEPTPAQPEPAPAQPEPAPAAPVTPADGQTKDTQDFEEAAALAEAKRKAEEDAARKKAAAEAEAKAKADAEARAKAEAEAKAKAEAEARKKARIEAEARAKAEAEAKAKAEAEARAKAEAEAKAAQAAAARNALRKGFGGAGTGDSPNQGSGTGSGNQGQVTGGASGAAKGGGHGNSFALEGRTLVGQLPKPTYNVQEEGTVVVEIIVDKYGAVTSANVTMKGTTIQNRTLWNQAVTAARKARFNSNASAAAQQKGTITYRFRLE